MTQEEFILPQLRSDLKLLRGPQLQTGEESWLIFDPVKNAYFRVAERAIRILRHWQIKDPEKLIAKINSETDDAVSSEDITKMVEFLYANRLTVEPPKNDATAFAAQEQAASPVWWKFAMHKYLFFRIPLFHPQAFLNATAGLVAPFFTKTAWWIIATIAIIALVLVSRQWTEFVQTFLHFLTLEGAAFYGLTLLVIMSAHELGHAYASHHFKCRVSTIGVAFLVMFPVLYIDTTDAWRLRDRRQRLIIDIAGVAVELAIAAIATLLWVFLPDGTARSAAFFAATTSWVLSLVVNLNPFLRFDGYYILSDMAGISNLQPRSFALGRWKMRELLFNFGRAAPEIFPPWKSTALIIFAWLTWVYRFFLFLGIALLVHAYFFRALGILLFVLEIAWFIARPVADEVKFWFSNRAEILSKLRARATVFLACCGVILMFIPWRSEVKIPAIATPQLQTEIFASTPGRLTAIAVEEGDRVRAGAVLFKLYLPEVEENLKQTNITIDLINARLARRVADKTDRADSAILIRSLLTEKERAAGLNSLLQDAIIRAPHDGVVNGLPNDLNENQWVNEGILLARVVETDALEIIALAQEKYVGRLRIGNDIKFIPDDILAPPLKGDIFAISNAAEHSITHPSFASVFGGRIAVSEDQAGALIPQTPIFKVRANIPVTTYSARTISGVAIIDAKAESPARAIWRRAAGVLLREADF